MIRPGETKALISRPQNGPIGEPREKLHERHQRLRKVLVSKDSGFLDEAFGHEREIVREPCVDPAFERAYPGDSFSSQQQRHTGAGRLVGSRAVENDVAIPRNLSVALFDLFHGYTKRTRDHLRKRLDIHGLAQVHD
jgi:hypothetical protein